MSDARPPVIEARDLILATLMHRKNLKLTDAVCRDAANNAATAIMHLLEERSKVVRGTIEDSTVLGETAQSETAQQMAERMIK